MVKDHEAFDYQASPNSLHEQKVNDLIPWAVNHAKPGKNEPDGDFRWVED